MHINLNIEVLELNSKIHQNISNFQKDLFLKFIKLKKLKFGFEFNDFYEIEHLKDLEELDFSSNCNYCFISSLKGLRNIIPKNLKNIYFEVSDYINLKDLKFLPNTIQKINIYIYLPVVIIIIIQLN